VKQQHTSTTTSILTTKSTYRSLSAQRLSERTVLFCRCSHYQKSKPNVPVFEPIDQSLQWLSYCSAFQSVRNKQDFLLLEPCISLIYPWKPNKCTNYSFNWLIMYRSSYIFGITLPSSRSVPRAFWEMLNWGAVDRILWMGVSCQVAWCVITTQHAHPQSFIDCSST
jgi:hypothetical protein